MAGGKRLLVHNWRQASRGTCSCSIPPPAREALDGGRRHLDPAGLAGINRIYFSADGNSYAYQIQRQLATLYVARA